MIQLITDTASVMSAEQASSDGQFNVLELGAGTGIAGLFCAKLMGTPIYTGLGVVNITLTDGEESCVHNLQANADLNFAADSSMHVICSQLWWGRNSKLDDLLACNSGGFSLIIGTDLIYNTTPAQAMALRQLMETIFLALKITPKALHDNCNYETGIEEKFEEGGSYSCGDNFYEAMPSCSADGGGGTGGGVFYLAFTHRSVPLQTILSTAEEFGLSWKVMEENCFDIFDNSTEGLTAAWRDTILAFKRVAI